MPRDGFPFPVDDSGTAALSLPMSLVLLAVGTILAAAAVGIGAVTSGAVGDRAGASTTASAAVPAVPAGTAVKTNNDGYVEALAVPSNMVGSWEGELIDPTTGDGLGPMTIMIQAGRIGQEVAFTTYPGFDCDGTASLRAGGPNARLFEKVDAAATGDTCVDADIALSVAPDDTLSVTMCVMDSETCGSDRGAQTGALRRVG